MWQAGGYFYQEWQMYQANRPKSSQAMRHWIGWSATVFRRPKIWTTVNCSFLAEFVLAPSTDWKLLNT